MRGDRERGAYSLRPASAEDQGAIRRLVFQGRINPRGLHWRNFIVAVDGCQRVIGCGQIKPHHDGSRELSSIVVAPDWQGGGIATAIVERLMQAGPPLWGICREELAPFYQRFGFERVLAPRASSPTFRRILRLSRWLTRLLPPGQAPCVLTWEPELAARLQAE